MTVHSAAAPRLYIVGAALLFSTGGVAIKAASLTGWQVASFRSGVAALAALFLLPGARGRWTLRTLLIAVAYATTMILFVAANKLTTAASTIFLQSTAPLYILLLSPWLLHESIRRRDSAFLAALALGLSLFFVGTEPVQSTAPDPTTGNILAVAAGLSWALTVIGLRWAARADHGATSSSAQAVLAGNLCAFVAALPMAFPLGEISTADVLVIAYLGVFQIGIAYRLLTTGMRKVTAFETMLLLLVEPALNPLWTWLVHGEAPTAFALAGGGIILGATVLKSWWDAQATA